MSLFNEKRAKSTDRRVRNYGPPEGCRERRIKRERRQTSISEISFHEWTRYLLRFKERAAAKAARRAADAANKAADKEQDLSQADGKARVAGQEDDADVNTTPT
jgi:hypothetical protein